MTISDDIKRYVELDKNRTQGEWYNDYWDIYQLDSDGVQSDWIATVGDSGKFTNAEFIAAAPDMLRTILALARDNDQLGELLASSLQTNEAMGKKLLAQQELLRECWEGLIACEQYQIADETSRIVRPIITKLENL